jgi:hypothetical protein
MAEIVGLRSKRGAIPKRKQLYAKAADNDMYKTLVMKYATRADQNLHAVVWTMSKGQVRQALKDIESFNFVINEFNV